jgi:hypothetical protein
MFLWSVLAHIHPVEVNAERTTHYAQYMDTLNVRGMDFPVKITDVKKCEKLKPTISINVFSHEKGEISPLYVTPLRERDHHVNLLLLQKKNGVQHFD